MGKKIQCVGRYAMDGVTLGKGNFAHVELATHGVVNAKVAIKIVDTRKIKDDYQRANLHREARIMAILRHPNIIRLYETLKATTLYCLVTEYCRGGELLAYIKSQKDQRLPEPAARTFIRQLVSAIHYVHERGIVHRDLKMENIMLDEKQKNIKLIDFGLSNIFKADEPLKTRCGSPEYAAPELFVVGKTYGPEIDIWSIGIVMYAMVVGRLPFFSPFKDEYHRQRMLQHIQKGLSPFHEREMQFLTADCRSLIHQLIEPNPELRIPLNEVETHSWLTKTGKCPFVPYTAPPRNRLMRSQVINDLATKMDMKKTAVAETVKEHRADELSAMYNLMMDRLKQEHGFFDIDHTRGWPQDRNDRSRSSDCNKIDQDQGARSTRLTTAASCSRQISAMSAKSIASYRKSGVGTKAKPKNRSNTGNSSRCSSGASENHLMSVSRQQSELDASTSGNVTTATVHEQRQADIENDERDEDDDDEEEEEVAPGGMNDDECDAHANDNNVSEPVPLVPVPVVVRPCDPSKSPPDYVADIASSSTSVLPALASSSKSAETATTSNPPPPPLCQSAAGGGESTVALAVNPREYVARPRLSRTLDLSVTQLTTTKKSAVAVTTGSSSGASRNRHTVAVTASAVPETAASKDSKAVVSPPAPVNESKTSRSHKQSQDVAVATNSVLSKKTSASASTTSAVKVISTVPPLIQQPVSSSTAEDEHHPIVSVKAVVIDRVPEKSLATSAAVSAGAGTVSERAAETEVASSQQTPSSTRARRPSSLPYCPRTKGNLSKRAVIRTAVTNVPDDKTRRPPTTTTTIATTGTSTSAAQAVVPPASRVVAPTATPEDSFIEGSSSTSGGVMVAEFFDVNQLLVTATGSSNVTDRHREDNNAPLPISRFAERLAQTQNTECLSTSATAAIISSSSSPPPPSSTLEEQSLRIFAAEQSTVRTKTGSSGVGRLQRVLADARHRLFGQRRSAAADKRAGRKKVASSSTSVYNESSIMASESKFSAVDDQSTRTDLDAVTNAAVPTPGQSFTADSRNNAGIQSVSSSSVFLSSAVVHSSDFSSSSLTAATECATAAPVSESGLVAGTSGSVRTALRLGCGLSPGSPSYDQRHARFSHIGAHALDVFFSPEDSDVDLAASDNEEDDVLWGEVNGAFSANEGSSETIRAISSRSSLRAVTWRPIATCSSSALMVANDANSGSTVDANDRTASYGQLLQPAAWSKNSKLALAGRLKTSGSNASSENSSTVTLTATGSSSTILAGSGVEMNGSVGVHCHRPVNDRVRGYNSIRLGHSPTETTNGSVGVPNDVPNVKGLIAEVTVLDAGHRPPNHQLVNSAGDAVVQNRIENYHNAGNSLPASYRLADVCHVTSNNMLPRASGALGNLLRRDLSSTEPSDMSEVLRLTKSHETRPGNGSVRKSVAMADLNHRDNGLHSTVSNHCSQLQSRCSDVTSDFDSTTQPRSDSTPAQVNSCDGLSQSLRTSGHTLTSSSTSNHVISGQYKHHVGHSQGNETERRKVQWSENNCNNNRANGDVKKDSAADSLICGDCNHTLSTLTHSVSSSAATKKRDKQLLLSSNHVISS